MPPLTVPDSFVRLVAACASCFRAPTYRIFCYLVAGWVHCPGRHTVTAVVLAAGAVGWRHVSAFHRFFGRARWEPDALGKIVFRLALRWIPAEQPLFVLGDDTLARKHGEAISLGAMHHDPLLSSARKTFCSFGHVWGVLALWVPLPLGPRGGPKGVALPVLFRLYVGSRAGNRADAPSRATSGARYRAARAAFPPPERRPTKSALAREGIGVVAGWAAELAPGRTVYLVGDAAYANRTTLEGAAGQRRGGRAPAPGRRALDARAAAATGAAGAAPQAGHPPAHPAGAGGRPHRAGHLARAAADPLRARGAPVGLHGHGAVVPRPARAARPLPRRARPPRATQGRGLLLHRPGGRRRLHPDGVRPALGPGGDLLRPQAVPGLRRPAEPDRPGRPPHRPLRRAGLRPRRALGRRAGARRVRAGVAGAAAVDPLTLRQLLRHTDLDTTMGYLRPVVRGGREAAERAAAALRRGS